MDATQFQWRLAALALILGTALLRLAYVALDCPLDLAPDEAYYWDWSRHLDWSYHSKGPLVAWLIRASCATFGDTVLAVRLPAIVCGSLLLVGLQALTVQTYQSNKLGLAIVVMALTLPIVAAGSTLMTIDAPFMAAWMGALVFGQRAVFRQERWAWGAAGVCVLLGMLAKPTMVLWFPSFACFLFFTPGLRRHLVEAGFWIMTTLGALGAVPIIVWNARHDWPILEHTQIHVGLDREAIIDWTGPLRYLGTQFAVLLGFWFVAWGVAMWRHRPTSETRPELRYLWWMSAPLFVFFGLFAFKNGGGEANWPLAAYLSGLVLAAGELARIVQHGWTIRQPWALGAVVCAAAGLLLTLLLHEPMPMQPLLLRLAGPESAQHPTPIRRVDPTSRLRGWQHLAAEVDRVRAELKSAGVDPVLAGERWTHAAELSFYAAGQPKWYCVGLPLGDRRSQYDLWRPNPVADVEVFRGRTFLVVGMELERLRPAFASMEEPRRVPYREDGVLVAEWSIAIGHGFQGFSE